MNKPAVIVDTGPLVAFLTAGDRHHEWAKDQFTRAALPALTCDAVLVEAFHLLRRTREGTERLLDLMQRGAFVSDLHVVRESAELAALIRKYSDVPMSLADACVVRLVETTPEAYVMTIDSDFRIYRQHGRRQIPLIMPDRI